MIKIAGISFFVAMVVTITGCSTVQSDSNAIKAEAVEPAPDAGFIEHPERQSKPSDLPFQKVWIGFR